MTADEIVRSLASADPCGYSEEGEDYHWCALCRASNPVGPADHADACAWRLAAEWCSSNPPETASTLQRYDGGESGE